MERQSRLTSRGGRGLTLPMDIPAGGRSDLDSHDESSPGSHSPQRHIATQTPTEHFSFTFDLPPCAEEMDKVDDQGTTEKRRRPMLYGKHSFREVRETSWIPRWFRRSSAVSDSSTPPSCRVQRSVSMSFSSSPEDAKEVGKQLRLISDSFEVCKGRSQSHSHISSVL